MNTIGYGFAYFRSTVIRFGTTCPGQAGGPGALCPGCVDDFAKLQTKKAAQDLS